MAKKKTLPVEPVVLPLQKSIVDITRDAYLDFGWYINNRRHLATLQDGLKISYRRLIYTAFTFPKHPLNPTNTLISAVQKYHPHGISSMNDMSASLVKSGVFAGEGSFGFHSLDGVYSPPANERYTHIAISPLWNELMGDLIKEVPYIESPQGEMEPTYIPSPLPISLVLSERSSGLGVGIKQDYPVFSAKSMYQAYMQGNPDLLEPSVDLILDKKHSELKKLWETGVGKIVYAYHLKKHKSSDGKLEGFLFETIDGSDVFTPNLKKLRKLEADGKVMIDDLTDIDSAKLFVSRIPGARGFSIDDLEKECLAACYDQTKYSLNITDGQTAYRIPLRDWIDYTYKNYISLVSQVNQKRIGKCQYDIAVLQALPIIADYILTKNPAAKDSEISQTLGIPEDIVREVMSKPIGYLRKNKDNQEKLKSLKAKLKELKAFDPVLFAESIVNRM